MRLLIIALPLLVASQVQAQPASPRFVGSWTGSLKQGTEDVEITINIAPVDTGGLRAWFDFPSQNIRGMEIVGAAFRGSEVSFPFGQARYEGRVDEAGAAIVGKVIGPGGEQELNYRRTASEPVLPAVEASIEDPDGVAGDFTGTIEAGGGLDGTLHLRRTAGGYAATLDVPAQNARGLTAETVSLEGDSLTVTFGFGSLTGTLDEARSVIDGAWTQAGRTFPFDLARVPAEN